MIQISSDVIRGYNDTMILYLLWDTPSYGYEISKKISEMTDGMYNIKETTLYSAFKRMEKENLPRVSCLNPGKTSRDLLQHVSRPDSPTRTREQ